jgi:HEAT repeat protein
MSRFSLERVVCGSWAFVVCVGLGATRARADIAVHADGRRVQVESPAKDSKGHWMGTIAGRRQRLEPGDVAVLVDDKGVETSLVPELGPEPKSAQQEAALAQLGDPKNDEWFLAATQLAQPPTRAVHDALVELAKGKRKELRARAITALTRLRTNESSLAAARAVLEEKDAKVRRDAAAALFSVREILRRCDSAELVAKGLADADALVRIEFALVAARDLELAGEVLRKDGLRHSDHHVRESCAVELGRRGDAAGASVLASMLARTSLPGLDTDLETATRILVAEQLEVCEILGRLGGDAAKAALTKAATSSPHEPVRKAAEAALAAAS